MTNLNAIIDAILHPYIPYFDEEHLIVGSVTFIVCLLFVTIIFLNDISINKMLKKQHEIIEELKTERKVTREQLFYWIIYPG